MSAPAAVEMDTAGQATIEVDDDEEVVVDSSTKFVDKFAKLIFPYYTLSLIIALIVSITLWIAAKKNPQLNNLFFVLALLLFIGGILGAWATFKFGVIMDQINIMKGENDKYEKEIGELRATKERLADEVGKLQSTVNELNQDASELEAQMGQFDELRNALGDIAKDNEQLNAMLNDTNKMFDDMRETVLENEKAHLLNFFYECALRDGDEGMSKREYRRFLGRLSEAQRAKFEAQGTFEELAGDDGIIDLQEFQDIISGVIADVDELLKGEFGGDDEKNDS